jgi:hypothetical protein
MAALATSNCRRCAMNWMFEPRSKDYYYDDDSGGGSCSSPISWCEILLFPLYIILFLIYLVIIEVLIIPFGLIYSDFCSTVKRVSESGKLEFPGLVYTGIAMAIILPILISNHLLKVLDHPFIVFCSSFFVLLFTVAPLTGLALRHFKHPKQ